MNIDAFTDRELASIALFFGMETEELRQKGKITLAQFQNQLNKTKFEGMDLKELLKTYFGGVLVSKKEVKQQKEENRLLFVESLKQKHPSLQFWFDYLLRKNPDSYWILRWMEEEEEKFQEAAILLNKAFAKLQESYEDGPC